MGISLLIFIVIFPLLLGFLQLFLPQNSKIWQICNVLGPIIFFAANCVQLYKLLYVDENPLNWQIFQLAPDINLSLQIDVLSAPFMVFVSFLWILNSIYALPYLRLKYEHKDNRNFFFWICTAIFATTLTAFSANVISMFFGYELLTLATLPLVIYSGLDNAKQSCNLYFNTLMFASIFFLFPAVLLLHNWAEFQQIENFWQILLPFCIVFGVAKAALFPFHFWLPRAMVAPTPVSAMFHAVAVVKIGILCLLKMIYVFSDLHAKIHFSAHYLHYLAGFSALYCSVVALRQQNIKAILAYSTLAQLSYIIMTICLWQTTIIWPVMLHIVSHGIAKIALFFGAGAISAKTRVYELGEMFGMAHKMPITMTCFSLCTLSIIGIPPFFGAFSKFFLIQQNSTSIFGMCIFIIATVLNALYLGKILFYAWDRNVQIDHVDEAPTAMLIPMLLCTVLSIGLGIGGFALIKIG